MEVQTAINKMNQLGSSSRPFLFMFDFELTQAQVYQLDRLNPDILFDFEGFSNYSTYQQHRPVGLDILSKNKADYKLAFHKVQDEIQKGNSYLTNLTWRHEVDCREMSLKEIFLASRARYKLFYKDKFIVFSPESFVRITDDTISSFPMKGTIDADVPNAREMILNDVKEMAEHNTIVDLIRNDLSKVANNVAVDNFRYLEEIQSSDKNLLQVSSKISGKLKNDFREKIGTMFYSLLPAGSVSGAPKERTMGIIREAELHDRGYYTGVCGIFDGKNINSFVMIRYLTKSKNRLFYHSGGGITALSQMDKEYQEILDKIYVPTN